MKKRVLLTGAILAAALATGQAAAQQPPQAQPGQPQKPMTAQEAKAMFAEKFKAAGYDPEGYTLYTYAAFEVFKQAAEKAGSTDAEKLAAAIHGQSYDTVLGKLTFDDKGDIVNPEYVFYVWSKGQYKEVGS